MWVKGEDGQMVECEVVATKDHESVFTKNAPILPLPFAVLCGILNFVPGKKLNLLNFFELTKYTINIICIHFTNRWLELFVLI